ncbi:MAG TPA: ABC transporter permease [Acidimicrobiales bacterium]|nr:ABC transporter permease [Acidimicrobiales bacterium]
MSTTSTAPQRSGSFHGVADLKLIARQTRYEQLSFWLNPIGALFTVGFSTVFLLIFESTSGKSTIGSLDGIKLIQYYVPGFVAYGIMSSCFSILSITMVNRREMGLLKRLRLSPAPTWILLTAVFASTALITIVQLVLMLAVGRGFGVHGPSHWLPFLIALVIGMFGFTALGMGVSTLVPNADAAGPVVNIVFFVVLAFSGLWYPISSGSTLSNVMGYLPVRALINALEYSFNAIPHTSEWRWHDILVIVVWGAAGFLMALRRWQWAPRRG